MSGFYKKIPHSLLRWAVCLLCVLVLYGTAYIPQLSTDTYTTVMDLPYNFNWMLTQNGRPAIAFFYWLWLKSGVSFEFAYHFSFCMAVLFLASAICLVQYMVRRLISIPEPYRTIVGTLAGVLIVLNVFSIEYFMFVEMGGFAMGIFAAVSAAFVFWRFLCSSRPVLLAAALGLAVWSALSYQATTGMLVVLRLPLICRYGRSVKAFLLDNALLALLYGGALGVDTFLMTVVFHSGRIGGVLSGFLPNLVRNLFTDLPNELNSTAGILPDGTYLTMLRWLVLVCIVAAVRRNGTLPRLAGILYVVIGTCFTAVFPVNSLLPRTIYPVGALGGLLLVYYLLNLTGEGCGALRRGDFHPVLLRRIGAAALAWSIGCFLCVQYTRIQSMIVDRYKTNAADKTLTLTIGAAMEEYEAQTGCTVTKLCFYEDANPITNYPGLFHRGAMGERGFLATWSRLPMMEYYLERSFAEGTCRSDLAELFAASDWDAYSPEQLVFDGDTLHICVY